MNWPEFMECDTARIYEGSGMKFLIIGWNRNTKTERDEGRDIGQWFKNDEPYDFDYVEEKIVASGRTDKELLTSAKEYKRISKLTTMEYIQELVESAGRSRREEGKDG